MIKLFNRKKATINSISIPKSGWIIEQNNRKIKQWINPEQTIALSVNYFDTNPDLPSITKIDVIRDFYRDQISKYNGGLIQVDVIELENYEAIKTIFKIPQEPSGMVYLASLTIPFQNCSYVIKIQAPEIEMIGERDSIIATRLVKEKKIFVGGNGYENWLSDPYDNAFDKGTLMNKSEEVIYDIDFENHPLTQARKLISQIEEEIEFKPKLEKLNKFEK